MPAFRCPSCSKNLKVADHVAGKRVRCPGCGEAVVVPSLTATQALSPQPSARSAGEQTIAARPNDDDEQDQSKEATLAGGNLRDPTLTGTPSASPAKRLVEFLAPPQAADELGRLGPYRVLKILGHGGMGVVYLAEDVKLKRQVALKAMLPSVAENEASAKRFLREAQAMAQLKHRHIATIHQVDEDRGVPYLAMEFLEGEPLDERLKREIKLPVPEVLRIGREIAEGLQAAHKRSLIHRDIKPANIWMEGEAGAAASVKILDFGLARSGIDDAHITQSGTIVGTPAFMAPEQARGGKVDARCDLFSLGVVLYRMATGEMPFKGIDTVSMLMAVAMEEPTPPREHNLDIPEDLSGLILKLLAKNPDDRCQTAQEVVATLAALEKGEAPATLSNAIRSGHPAAKKTVPAPVPESRLATSQPGSTPRKRRSLVGLLAALAVPCLVGSIWFAWQQFPNAENRIGPPIVPIKDVQKPPLAWTPGPADNVIPGPIARPAKLPGMGRWQIVLVSNREHANTNAFWSPDGKLITIANPLIGDTTRIYDAATTELKYCIKHPVNSAPFAYSADGASIAIGMVDGTVHVWRFDGTPENNFPAHRSNVLAVAWSRDGKIATASHPGNDDPGVKIWTREGKLVADLPGHKDVVRSLAWTPDGQVLASSSQDKTVRLWSADGKPGAILAVESSSESRYLAWRPDGQQLVSGTGDQDLRSWNRDGNPLFAQKHGSIIWNLTWHPEGQEFAVCGGHFGVHIYNSAGQQTKVLNSGGSPTYSLSYRPKGDACAITGYPGIREIHDLKTKQIAKLASGAFSFDGCSSSPDGKSIAMTTHTPWIHTLDWDGTPKPPIRTEIFHHDLIFWNKDQTRWLARKWGHGAFIHGTKGESSIALGQDPTIKAVCWSPDGTQIASCGADKKIRFWSADGKPVSAFETPHEMDVFSMAWSPDGKWIATLVGEAAHASLEMQLWSVDGKLAWKRDKKINLNTIHWRSDSKAIVAVGVVDNHGVESVDLEGKRIAFIDAGGWAGLISLSRDGNRVARAIGNHVRLSSFDGTLAGVLTGHTESVSGTDWSADGTRVVTAAHDATMRVWDVATKETLWTAILLSEGRLAVFDTAGNLLHGDPKVIERELAYLVEVPGGQLEVLKPSEFAERIPRVEAPKDPPIAARPGPADNVFPGPIARPAKLPGIGRWQITSVNAREHGHTNVFWSRDGKLITIGSPGNGNTTRVHDAATAELKYCIKHPVGSTPFAYSLDDALIAMGMANGTVRIWRFDGTPEISFQAHRDRVNAIAWSRDGKIATASHPGDDDPGIKIWSRQGKLLADLPGHKDVVRGLAWTPDGKILASSSQDKTVRLWSSDGEPGLVLAVESSSDSRYLAWRPDGQQLVSATFDRDLRSWDRDGNPLFAVKHGNGISDLTWHPEGREFAVCGGDYTVHFFDRDGRQTKVLNAGGAPTFSLSFRPDGAACATSAFPGVREIHDLKAKQVAKFASGLVQFESCAASPDGKSIALTSAPWIVALDWDGTPKPSVKTQENRLDLIFWNKNQTRWLARNWANGASLYGTKGEASIALAQDPKLMALCWSPDGSQIATVGADKKIRFWSAEGKPVSAFETPHEKDVFSIAWSPDGKWLATLAANDQDALREMHLWSIDGKLVWKLAGKQYLHRIHWRPDSKALVAVNLGEKQVGVESIGLDGNRIAFIDPVGFSSSGTMSLSRDGNRVARAAGALVNDVRLSSFDGTLAGVLTGHTESVSGTDWSADGTRLATSSRDATMRVWDVATKETLWTAILLSEGRLAVFDTAGNLLHGDPKIIERELAYLVELPGGRLEVLKPSEFAERVRANQKLEK